MDKRVLTLAFAIYASFGFLPAFASVKIQQTSDLGWQLLVDDKPYFIKGIEYRVNKVGESPDNGTLKDFSQHDVNRNGVLDGPYEAWVDKNLNNVQDVDEPNIGDFQLMKDMGANTIRWYVKDKGPKANKELFRELFSRYGIRMAVGNKFGAYTIGSGASWEKGTDYRDPRQQKRLLQSIKEMVLEHKDEPYTLIWLIGNENNYKWTNTNAHEYPESYAQMVNRAAKLIHELDGKHPVAVVNGDTRLLAVYQKYCPDVDIFAVNAYRGSRGFGSLWKEIKRDFDRPVLISEYGGAKAAAQGEEAQAKYHKNCWLDIEKNRAGGEGVGNAIGGFIFEWMDEWWKAGDPKSHAKMGTKGRQGKDMASWAQEYCGILTQGDGSKSPFIRQPRRAYYMYQELWNR